MKYRLDMHDQSKCDFAAAVKSYERQAKKRSGHEIVRTRFGSESLFIVTAPGSSD